MNNQPEQPNIYQQAAAELRDMAAGLEESVTINGAWPTGYDKEREITFTLRRLAWSLETDAAVRAETIASLQAALDLSRAENNRLRDHISNLAKASTIERAYAYSAARSDIECMCQPEGESANPSTWWWDTSMASFLNIEALTGASVDERETIQTAVNYLTTRNLLERHPENPDLVRILEPKE